MKPRPAKPISIMAQVLGSGVFPGGGDGGMEKVDESEIALPAPGGVWVKEIVKLAGNVPTKSALCSRVPLAEYEDRDGARRVDLFGDRLAIERAEKRVAERQTGAGGETKESSARNLAPAFRWGAH